MQATIGAIGKGSDNFGRGYNPDGSVRNRALDRPPLNASLRESTLESESEFAPSTYMMLISRVDQSLRQGAPDAQLVRRLSDLIAQRLQMLNPVVRHELLTVPEVRALDVQDATRIPETVRSALSQSESAQAAMALLRSPRFAATIRNEPRLGTYGPQGLLKAS